MEKVLFLDANETLIESIKYAHSKGILTITCDNKKENPGHAFSDKQYYVSTYDLDGLSQIVENESIDGIVYFCSLHGLYGACRLIEKYSLPGFSFSIEQTISDKFKFREFLSENGFNVPKYISLTTIQEMEKAQQIPLPVIVKPVDGGGNRGITKVEKKSDLKKALISAFKESICKRIVVEEFIDSDLQINGDCLFVSGKLVLSFLGQHLYPNKQSILPYATIFGPDVISDDLKKKVDNEIQKIITQNHLINGVLNVEIRVSPQNEIYFIEINPRHSGNRIYSLMDQVINIPMEHISVELSLNHIEFLNNLQIHNNKYFAYCLLYSDVAGTLDDVELSDSLQNYIISKQIFKHKGDIIRPFTVLRERVGLLHLAFPNKSKMDETFSNIKSLYKIKFYNENK